jgi:hypothetical protein
MASKSFSKDEQDFCVLIGIGSLEDVRVLLPKVCVQRINDHAMSMIFLSENSAHKMYSFLFENGFHLPVFTDVLHRLCISSTEDNFASTLRLLLSNGAAPLFSKLDSAGNFSHKYSTNAHNTRVFQLERERFGHPPL